MGVRLAKEAVMRVLMWPTAAALLVAVELFSVPAANAQVQSPSPGPSGPSLDISDLKLDTAPGLSDGSPDFSDHDAGAMDIENRNDIIETTGSRRAIASARPNSSTHRMSRFKMCVGNIQISNFVHAIVGKN